MNKELEKKFDERFKTGSSVKATKWTFHSTEIKSFIDEHFVEKGEEDTTFAQKVEKIVEDAKCECGLGLCPDHKETLYTKEQVLELIGEDKGPEEIDTPADRNNKWAYNRAKKEIRERINDN